MILLKTDGTLWRWGTKHRDLYLVDIKPHRLGDESDWMEIISTDFGLFAWEKNGGPGGLTPKRRARKTPE